MDALEAANRVLSRIQNLDPQNASKIMGYILIQEHGDKDIIRLAHSPDALLFSLIIQAKAFLGLSSNSSSAASTPSPPSPGLGPFSQASFRIMIPNNEFNSSPPWSNGSPVFSRSPVSYADSTNTFSGLPGSSIPLSFCNGEPIDQLPLLDESCDSHVFPLEEAPLTHDHLHQQRCSANEVFTSDSDDGGISVLGWRRCMCNSCKFLHGASAAFFGSPNKVDASFDDFLRIKALQQQRSSADSLLMASGDHYPFTYNNCMINLNINPRWAPAALMIGEEFQRFGRCLPEACNFSGVGLDGYSNACSQQIYLTFPADSTFSEEDVSNYFSIYGPVQDVRIPYQQKRMFGFVTFVYPETVKLILAQGNPHFVCDSRVLVKPYKEKGKALDKNRKQQQHHMNIGNFSACLSPSGLDSKEPFYLPFGPRMFYNSQEAMLRRKNEQEAELQKAIELHSRRLKNLQLMDLKNKENCNQFQPSSSPIISVSCQGNSQSPNYYSLTHKVTAENNCGQEASVGQENNNGNENIGKEQCTSPELHKRDLEHVLPGKFVASPVKSAAENLHASYETDSLSPTRFSNIPTLPPSACPLFNRVA